MNEEALTVSVPEAARMLGIGRTLGFRLVREGRIPALRLGKKLRVPLLAVKRMLADAATAPQGVDDV